MPFGLSAVKAYNAATAGYAPPQWSNRPDSNTLIVVTPSTVSFQGINPNGIPIVSGSLPQIFVFDAVLRGTHRQELTVTKNPIQTGAAITDHAYINPAEFSADIMMSDSMQSYVPNQFSGAASRSAAAYQLISSWQALKLVLQVSTRLRTYPNVVVKTVSVEETHETLYTLKCTVMFEQLLLATQTLVGSTSSDTVISLRPNSSNSSQIGIKNTQTVLTAMQSQYNVQNSTDNLSAGETVQGAGNWSSLNTGYLSTVLPVVPN